MATSARDANGIAAERIESLVRENAQLRQALDSRVVIEQAKGVLAERFGVDIEEAFVLLRRSARSNRVRIHDLATAVTRGANDELLAAAHARKNGKVTAAALADRVTQRRLRERLSH